MQSKLDPSPSVLEVVVASSLILTESQVVRAKLETLTYLQPGVRLRSSIAMFPC